jgi:hypothetical protein
MVNSSDELDIENSKLGEDYKDAEFIRDEGNTSWVAK